MQFKKLIYLNLVLFLLMVGGCAADTKPMTDQEYANFKQSVLTLQVQYQRFVNVGNKLYKNKVLVEGTEELDKVDKLFKEFDEKLTVCENIVKSPLSKEEAAQALKEAIMAHNALSKVLHDLWRNGKIKYRS